MYDMNAINQKYSDAEKRYKKLQADLAMQRQDFETQGSQALQEQRADLAARGLSLDSYNNTTAGFDAATQEPVFPANVNPVYKNLVTGRGDFDKTLRSIQNDYQGVTAELDMEMEKAMIENRYQQRLATGNRAWALQAYEEYLSHPKLGDYAKQKLQELQGQQGGQHGKF